MADIATAPEFTPEIVEALREAFLDWYGENFNILEGGGAGDVQALLVTLNAAYWKAPSSNGTKLSDCSKA